MNVPYPSFLITQDSLREMRGIGTLTADDNILKRCVKQASAWFENEAQRSFVPYHDTKAYDAVGRHVSPRFLDVDDDLLSVTTVLNGDGIDISANVITRPNNITPKYRLELTLGSNVIWNWNTTPEQAISVNGIWGYHAAYARAWEAVDSLVGSLTNTGTLAVISGGTLDENGMSPRFGVFDYLQLDNEMALVTGVNGSTLTLRRGVNGSTAGTHAAATGVNVYRQAEDIRRAVTFLAGYYKDVKDVSGNGIQILDFAMKVDRTIAEEIIDTVERYKWRDMDVI